MDRLFPIIRRVRRPLIVADALPPVPQERVEPVPAVVEPDKGNRDAENEGTGKGAEDEEKY